MVLNHFTVEEIKTMVGTEFNYSSYEWVRE